MKEDRIIKTSLKIYSGSKKEDEKNGPNRRNVNNKREFNEASERDRLVC
jgi:hypothetical protein